MALYEYQCIQCGAGRELSRPVANRHDPVECGEVGCQGEMKLVPSLTSFALQGGGWTPKGPAGSPAPPRVVKRSSGYDMTGSRED